MKKDINSKRILNNQLMCIFRAFTRALGFNNRISDDEYVRVKKTTLIKLKEKADKADTLEKENDTLEKENDTVRYYYRREKKE